MSESVRSLPLRELGDGNVEATLVLPLPVRGPGAPEPFAAPSSNHALRAVPQPPAPHAPIAQPPPPTEGGARAAPAAPAPKLSPRARRVGLGLVALALTAYGTFVAMTWGTESTDDAQVEGRVINVAPQLRGVVAKVLVEDNERVAEGQPLLELDKPEFEAAAAATKAEWSAAKAHEAQAAAQLAITEASANAGMTQAEGSLAQAHSGLFGSSASVEEARADLTSASARLHLAELEFERSKALAKQGSVSAAELDQRQGAVDVARANQSLARARLNQGMAGASGSQGQVLSAKARLVAAQTAPQQIAAAKAAHELTVARVELAAANVRLAEYRLAQTVVRAPRAGIVSRKTVQVGQTISPEHVALAVVPTDDVWVVANFKEDQLARMKAGQKVTFTLDTFGRKKFHGRVGSIAGATGARFALLPPDNATGNFIKVTQRVPVLVKLDPAPDVELRPGMSAYVTVDLRH